LARHWSMIQIGDTKSAVFERLEIRTKEFRENLEWAVVVPGDREISPGAAELLTGLAARGIVTEKCGRGCW